MIRQVSGNDRAQTPQPAEVAPHDAKATGVSSAQVAEALEAKLDDVQVVTADTFQLAVPGQDPTRSQTASTAQAPVVDAAGLAETLSTLESLANSVTSEVKKQPMAQDVKPAFPEMNARTFAATVPPQVAMGALVLHHSALAGELGADTHKLDILRGFNGLLAQQFDSKTKQRAKLEGEAAVSFQSFQELARARLSSAKAKAEVKGVKRSAGARASEDTAAATLDVSDKTLSELHKAWAPVQASVQAIDVDELAEIIMLECAKEQEGELNDVLNDMAAASKQKGQLREMVTAASNTRARLESDLRDEYNARTKLDPKNSLYVDPTQVTFDQYEKDREIASNQTSWVTDPTDPTNPKPTLGLTNNLKIYARPETGAIPSADSLDAGRRTALDAAKQAFDQATASYNAHVAAAKVAFKAKYDADADAFNAQLDTDKKNKDTNATNAETADKTAATHAADLAQQLSAAQADAAATKVKIDMLTPVVNALRSLGIKSGPMQDQLDAANLHAAGLVLVIIALVFSIPGANRDAAAAHQNAINARSLANAADSAAVNNRESHIDIGAVTLANIQSNGFTEQPPVDRRGSMFSGNDTIDSALSGAMASNSGAQFDTVFNTIVGLYPEKKQFDAYVTWLGVQVGSSGAGLVSALQARFVTDAASKQAAADAGNAAQFKSHPTDASLKPTTLAEFDGCVQQLKDKMDSLGDMTQQMQIKIQLALDRRSKLYETLSAIMKKSSSTDDAIIGNMK